MEVPSEIWTVGHSNQEWEKFAQLLKSWRIEALADVRRFAVSRRFPHFSQMALFKGLAKMDVEYAEFANLGGRRRSAPDSPNTVWRNESFRGYADYMMTEPFRQAIGRLLELANRKRTAILCAESLWWRCHRALIADYLKTMGIKVTHILGPDKSQEHPYTSAAQVRNGKLTYAKPENLELAIK